MHPVPDLEPFDVIFSTKAMKILPPYAEIPAEFKKSSNRWAKVASDWFFRGMRDAKWTPRPGVDTKKALAAIFTCLGDFEPSHEHKEAGVAFLLNEWFEDVTYKPAK